MKPVSLADSFVRTSSPPPLNSTASATEPWAKQENKWITEKLEMIYLFSRFWDEMTSFTRRVICLPSSPPLSNLKALRNRAFSKTKQTYSVTTGSQRHFFTYWFPKNKMTVETVERISLSLRLDVVHPHFVTSKVRCHVLPKIVLRQIRTLWKIGNQYISRHVNI